MKEIAIYLDHKQFVKSFNEVKTLIKSGADTIETYCLDFFTFDYYDMGYDVVIYKSIVRTDKDYTMLRDLFKEYTHIELIRLSELLDPEKRKQYTQKEIRREHNVLKMFKAGAFKLKDNKE